MTGVNSRGTQAMGAVLTILCQGCNRAKAEWNVDVGPGLLRALCDKCKRANDRACVSEHTCRHGVSILRECGACSASYPGQTNDESPEAAMLPDSQSETGGKS